MIVYECLLCGAVALGGNKQSTKQGIATVGGVLIHRWEAHTGSAGGGLGKNIYLCNDCVGTKSLHEAVDTAWRKAWAQPGV